MRAIWRRRASYSGSGCDVLGGLRESRPHVPAHVVDVPGRDGAQREQGVAKGAVGDGAICARAQVDEHRLRGVESLRPAAREHLGQNEREAFAVLLAQRVGEQPRAQRTQALLVAALGGDIHLGDEPHVLHRRVAGALAVGRDAARVEPCDVGRSHHAVCDRVEDRVRERRVPERTDSLERAGRLERAFLRDACSPRGRTPRARRAAGRAPP